LPICIKADRTGDTRANAVPTWRANRASV